MAFLDIFKASAIKAENVNLLAGLDKAVREKAHLEALLHEIGGTDLIKVKEMIKQHESVCAEVIQRREALQKEADEIEQQVKVRRRELLVLDDQMLLESFALYKPKFAFVNSAEYKGRLDQIRESQKAAIRAGRGAVANENWSVNGSASEGKKMTTDMKKLLLRSFNNECDYCVDNVKFNNVESHAKRIDKSFDALRKLGRILNAQVTDEYRKLKLDELHLAFEYQVKKQEEKEELRSIREEEREQQKLEQEIKQARDKIAKEKKHFSIALKDLEAKLADPTNVAEHENIARRIVEIKGQYTALDDEEKVIDYREKNAKAGYVYIISNVGAFGVDVFKIGMTRRLDPTDRVDELGDASVPFRFDVHAMIFSDNAPALESKLHDHFEKHRVNKINARKEFFKADLSEIEKVVRENYEKVFDLVREAPAEHYREGLLM